MARLSVGSPRRRRRGLPALPLIGIYLAVALAPLGGAYLQGLPPRPFLDELSSGLALIALAMLLVEFVLSGRFETISGRIGIDLTMRYHQLIARSLTVFVLVHPFLYTTPSRGHPLPWDVSRQLGLGLSSGSIVSGVLAWLLLPCLVAIGIFRDRIGWRYEIWRAAHGLGAVVVALLALHHALAAGRYSAAPLMIALWSGLTVIALASLAYVHVVTPLRQLRHRYRVGAVRSVARKTWELSIEPERGPALEFDAGQFVWLTVGRSPFAITEHPFSLASCPSDRPRVTFLVKEAGDFTNTVGRIRPGTSAYLDGPHGNFTLVGRAGAGLIFIAGGVGLAAILSILRQLQAESDPRPMKLIYGNRTEDQIAYAAELEEFRRALDLDLVHVLSEPPPNWPGEVGMFDEELLRRRLSFDGQDRWLHFVCGPPPMIEAVEGALAGLGVPLRQIVSEKFKYE